MIQTHLNAPFRCEASHGLFAFFLDLVATKSGSEFVAIAGPGDLPENIRIYLAVSRVRF
jgi:hypothetical protein